MLGTKGFRATIDEALRYAVRKHRLRELADDIRTGRFPFPKLEDIKEARRPRTY